MGKRGGPKPGARGGQARAADVEAAGQYGHEAHTDVGFRRCSWKGHLRYEPEKVKVKKEPDKPKAPELDELELYLADPEEPDINMDVLAWWKAKESKWPKLPKMVKQYFASPASSAGVERVFSAAGKMHGDLQKSAKDTTLEHSLFAAFNTE